METGAATAADRKAASRERILEAAAAAIRRHGPGGVSVSSVMKEAGLTHGAFYAHFASKEDLVAAALTHAGNRFCETLDAATDGTAGYDRLSRMGAAYMSREHLRHEGVGCPIAAVGPEASRMEGPPREAIAQGVEKAVAMVEEALVGAFGPGESRRDEAIATLATSVGAVVLARATGDPAEADRILAACRHALAERSAGRRADASSDPLAGEAGSRATPAGAEESRR
jgi:TetR/AcrR family transcriptional repressor of nem operon